MKNATQNETTDRERADWLATRAGAHLWTDIQRDAWLKACIEIFDVIRTEGRLEGAKAVIEDCADVE